MRQFDFMQEGFEQRKEYYSCHQTDRSGSNEADLPSGAVWKELDEILSTLTARRYVQYLWNSRYARRATSYFGVGRREQDDGSRKRCQFGYVDHEFDHSLTQFMVRMVESVNTLILKRKRGVQAADFKCYDPHLARRLALCPIISEQGLDI